MILIPLLIWLQSLIEAQFLMDILKYFCWLVANGQYDTSNPWLGNIPSIIRDETMAVGKAIWEAMF